MVVEKVIRFTGCAAKLGTDTASKLALLRAQTKNLRVRAHLAHHHPRERYTIGTTHGLLSLRDNFGDITNVTNLLCQEVYSGLRPLGEGEILDVGANIGLAATWFAHRYPGHRIHCFEPVTDAASMIALNCPDAIINPVAVSDAPGDIELQVDPDEVIASSIPTRWTTRPARFPTIRLDDYCNRNGIDHVAALKIDTEGMEIGVLRGAIETLARTDQIAMETHGRERHDAALELLRSAGFEITKATFGEATGMVFAIHGTATGAGPASAHRN
jgi:FkbM family methyltransferase